MAEGDRNAAAIRKAIEAGTQRDFASLQELIRPEFQRHDLSGGLPEVSGEEGPGDLIQLLLKALPDMPMEIVQLFATQERVAAQISVSGTHQGELFGVPASGKRVEIGGINLYRMVDGKLAETWQLEDVWGLIQQLGAAPPLGGEG